MRTTSLKWPQPRTKRGVFLPRKDEVPEPHLEMTLNPEPKETASEPTGDAFDKPGHVGPISSWAATRSGAKPRSNQAISSHPRRNQGERTKKHESGFPMFDV